MWGEEKFMQGFGGETRRKEATRKSWARMEGSIKMVIKRPKWASWIGLSWLRTGTGGGLL